MNEKLRTNKLGTTKQKNVELKIGTLKKLTELRNYHNKTYNNLFEILIDNAFLKMDEEVNLDKADELKEQNLKVSFQVQQLTLMFAELKKELAEVRTEYFNLKENNLDLKTTTEKQAKNINEIEVKNKERSTRYTEQIKVLNEWVSNKDKSFLDKIKERM